MCRGDQSFVQKHAICRSLLRGPKWKRGREHPRAQEDTVKRGCELHAGGRAFRIDAEQHLIRSALFVARGLDQLLTIAHPHL